MDVEYYSNNLILPVPIPEIKISTLTPSDFLQHWSYVLYCHFNEYNLHLVESLHTVCDTDTNSDIFNNRDNNIKVIFSAPLYLNWYEDWERNIVVNELDGQQFLRFHCPVCGHEN